QDLLHSPRDPLQNNPLRSFGLKHALTLARNRRPPCPCSGRPEAFYPAPRRFQSPGSGRDCRRLSRRPEACSFDQRLTFLLLSVPRIAALLRSCSMFHPTRLVRLTIPTRSSRVHAPGDPAIPRFLGPSCPFFVPSICRAEARSLPHQPLKACDRHHHADAIGARATKVISGRGAPRRAASNANHPLSWVPARRQVGRSNGNKQGGSYVCGVV